MARALSVLCGVVVAAVSAVTACRGEDTPRKSTLTVEYRVEGTAKSAFAHFTLADGTASDTTSFTPPWTKTVEVAPGTTVAILIRRVGAVGTVRCELEVEGQRTGTQDFSDKEGWARCTANLP